MLKRVEWLDGFLFDLRLTFRGLRRDRLVLPGDAQAAGFAVLPGSGAPSGR